jgi:hypothetical protein
MFLTLDERQNNVALRSENFVPRETNASFLGPIGFLAGCGLPAGQLWDF